MWKSPAVSGSIKRICAAAPAWKFSESREVLSAYEMGAPAMRSPMADTSATEMWAHDASFRTCNVVYTYTTVHVYVYCRRL